MKRIELKITALSPLAISRQKSGGSVSEVESYIPGSVIRGAFAGQILQQYGQINANLAESDNHFQSLFLSEHSAIFQNAYPAIAKISEDEFKCVTDEVRVLPATAVSSKADSGFKPNKNGVFDTLIDRFCAEAYNYPFDPSDPKSLEDKTDPRVEPYGGFYSKTADSEVLHKYRIHSVSTRFLTRVGINRRRATSEDDILYSIEVLNESFVKNQKANLRIWENIVYRSLILVEKEEIAKLLQGFIKRNSDRFHLGGSVSRGLGKVKIEVTDGIIPESVEARIKKFNQKLENRWKEWSVFCEPRENLLASRTYFTLDLQSDAILTEKWRRTTIISPEMLCQLAGLEEEFSKLDSQEKKDNFLKLDVAYSSYDYRSGWNSGWGLMKDVDLIINKGGVYLFSTTQPDIWMDKLGQLEEKGVGDRTCEGFGQIQICNEFHLVFRDKPV